MPPDNIPFATCRVHAGPSALKRAATSLFPSLSLFRAGRKGNRKVSFLFSSLFGISWCFSGGEICESGGAARVMDEEQLGRFRQPDRAIPAGIAGDDDPSDHAGPVACTVIESTNTEWTDEKHSLYLNSIEESFVKQLYSHDFCLNDSNGWLLRGRADPHSPGSNVNNLYSCQFKVQRRGCWEELKFERSPAETESENQSRSLSANQWIKHFRSPTTVCQRHEKAGRGASSSSKQLLTSPRDVYLQESIGSSTEVSDQNFADDEREGVTQLSRAFRKKRARNVVSGASGKDQVVPYRKDAESGSHMRKT